MIGLSAALEGLNQAELQLNQAAAQIARPPLPPSEGVDTADLSAAAVALIQSRNNFDANIKLIKTADEIEKTLLDVVG